MKNTLFPMKSMFVFLIFLSLELICSKAYSQTVSVSIQKKQISLEELFHLIEKQTEFLFFYVDNDVKGIRVDVSVSRQPVQEVLTQALSGTNLQFLIKDRHINILKKDAAKQQKERTITGVVLDNKGETIIGASLLVMGTTTGTITDMDGKFSLPVPADMKELVCNYIGYEKKVVSILGNSFF